MAIVLTGRVRGATWIALAALVGGGLAGLVAPLLVLRPFAAQTPDGLAFAFWLRRLAPAASWAALVAALLFAWLLWPGSRRWGKAALVGTLFVLAALAGLSRINPFERMFAPLPERAYAKAAAADFVAPGEMVLGVAQDGEEVAYPVRQLAYHHVVEDVVGGRPLVVTY